MMRTINKAVAIAAFILICSPVAIAAVPEAKDLTQNFLAAGAAVNGLQVYEVSGIVIIRGKAVDQAQAEEVGRLAQSMGYVRVANLIQVVENRDREIARRAEVELTVNRSLDGCKFRVTSDQGVIRVAGEVKHELQKDVAMQVLRSINGVRGIEVNLSRF